MNPNSKKLVEIRDHSERNENRLCELLNLSRDANIISADIFDKLKSIASHIPRIAEGGSVRSSLTTNPGMSGSSLRTTAKWLSGILNPLQTIVAKYSIRDLFGLLKRNKHCTTSDKRKLYFDV